MITQDIVVFSAKLVVVFFLAGMMLVWIELEMRNRR